MNMAYIERAKVTFKAPASIIAHLTGDYTPPTLSSLLNPPFPSLTGISSLVPPYGERVSASTVHSHYCDAIAALSERLGHDQWFLGSSSDSFFAISLSLNLGYIY